MLIKADMYAAGGDDVKMYELTEAVLSSYKITCKDSSGNKFKPKVIFVVIKYNGTNNLCAAYMEDMSTANFLYNYNNVTIALQPIGSQNLIASVDNDGFTLGTGWPLSACQNVHIYAIG